MDDLKVAFETIIVGIFAVPWLAVLFFGLSALFDAFARWNPLSQLVRQLRGERELGEGLAKFGWVFVLALAYFTGASVSRLADRLTGLRYETRFLHSFGVKSDGCIRMLTYFKAYAAQPALLDPASFPPRLASSVGVLQARLRNPPSCLGNTADYLKAAGVKPLYDYQKYRVYNASAAGFETLRHIESEIVVLRGGFLNGVILCLVSLPYLVTALVIRLAVLARRPRDRHNWLPDKSTSQFLVLLVLGAALAWMGRSAWQAVEEEYDGRVIALFHTLGPPQPLEAGR